MIEKTCRKTKENRKEKRKESIMTNKRFTDELEPTIEQKESGRVFTSAYGQENDDFLNGEWFNGLVELVYFYFKAEIFLLIQEGCREMRMFDSYVDKLNLY